MDNNIIKVGNLYKHFKGKNIYRVISLNNNGKELDSNIKYTGTGDVSKATNLVIYKNIFNEMLFARELDDFYVELSKEEQDEFGQVHRVEPLTMDEEKELMKK